MLTTTAKKLCIAAAMALSAAGIVKADTASLEKSFQQPPDDSKMMVRWWWFGPAVTHPELEREMKAMKDGGIGGFEIEPIYALGVDDERPGFKNLPIGSPELLEALKFTAAKAKELGLRMDLTLGSGWPYGGPQFSAKEGATAVTNIIADVPAGTRSVPVPQNRNQTPVAAFVLSGETWKECPIANNAIEIPADIKDATQVMFVMSREGIMVVKRPAVNGQGFVIDNYSSTVVDRFIKEIGEPAIAATAPNFPYAIFCDSLEVNGENWSPDLLNEFKKRRGYDLRPLLPALFVDIGPKTAEIRHDWMQTCTEMFNDNFSAKFKALANKYGSKFRIQGYGSPPHAMYSYASSDLAEGEGFNWQTFDEERWASSASHLLGRPVTSAETWTWLKQAVFYATPLDIKGEANQAALQGINQFIAHGWPYSPAEAKYPGWSMYAAAVFNDHNPWWIVMPDVTKYLQRISFMLRQGTPANDVLVYLPNSDSWANRDTSINTGVGGRAVATGGGGGRGGARGAGARGGARGGARADGAAPAAPAAPAEGAAPRGRRGGGGGGAGSGDITGSILAAGYNLDYFDDQLLDMRGKVDGNSIAFGDVKYRAVVIPQVTHIMPGTMKKLDEFAKNGGIVIGVGAPPQLAPGYLATEADQKTVTDIGQRLFGETAPTGKLVSSANEIGAAIAAKGLQPDVTFGPANFDVGFVHRHTADGEVYFVANTSNQPVKTKGTFRAPPGTNPEVWDPMTGKSVAGGSGNTVNFDLEPYGSAIVVFSTRTVPAAPAVASSGSPIDISTGWTVKFGNDGPTVNMDKLTSWTENEATKAFAGVASYTKKVNVTDAMLKDGKLSLSLGQATAPQGGGGRGGNGYRTNLESPVREAAVVYVNDKRVGSIWAPPYKLDVTSELKAGENTIRIDVGNLAVNYMAANGYPNYNLQGVRQAYGNLFDPQGLNNLQPLPAGLLGPIQLVPTTK